MKLPPLFFCLLIAVSARAASPSYSDFNLNQFGTNAGVAGNGVRIKSGANFTNLNSGGTLTILSRGKIDVGGYQLTNAIDGDGSLHLIDSGNSAEATFVNGTWIGSFNGQFTGGGLSASNLFISGNNATSYLARVTRIGSSLIISSNTLANLPTLLKGDMAFWSSNSVPYYITSDPSGVLATNAFGSGGGSGTVQNLTVTTTGLTESGNGTATLVLTSPSAVVTNGFTPALNLGGVVTATNSLLLRSNTLASIPTLIKGDTYFWVSNGTPYVIASGPTGTLTTNLLVFPGNAGGGPFTNLSVFQGLWDTNVATGHYTQLTNGDIIWGGNGGTNASLNGNISFDDTGTASIANGVIFSVRGRAADNTTDYILGSGLARLGNGNITFDNNGAITATKLLISGGPNYFGNSFFTNGATATNTDSTKVPFTIGMNGIGTNVWEVRTNGVLMGYITNGTLYMPSFSGSNATFTGSTAAGCTNLYLNFGTTNSIVMTDTNGTTTTRIYSQSGTLYSSASPPQRTVSVDEYSVISGTTTTLIDGKTTGATTLYTVPTGRQFILQHAYVIPTTVTSLTTPSTVSIGKTSSTYIDVIAATALTGLVGANTSINLAPITGASVLQAGDVLKVNVSVAAIGTAYTFSVVVTGILL